jgi:hypothetical protein
VDTIFFHLAIIISLKYSENVYYFLQFLSFQMVNLWKLCIHTIIRLRYHFWSDEWKTINEKIYAMIMWSLDSCIVVGETEKSQIRKKIQKYSQSTQ